MLAPYSSAFERNLHAVTLIDVANQSLRKTSALVGIPKSTLHDNLEKYRSDMALFQSWQDNCEADLVRRILITSLDGKVSSRDCATLMAKLFNTNISHQFVLSVLGQAAEIAKQLNNQSPKQEETDRPLAMIRAVGVDEIFQKRIPILGLIDLTSGYLRMEDYKDRSEESWTAFLSDLKSLGLNPETVTADGGQSALKAMKMVFPDAIRVRDLFHVLYKLNKALKTIEGSCYRLIIEGDKSSDPELHIKMNQTIELYDLLEERIQRFSKVCYFSGENEYVSSAQVMTMIDGIVNNLAELKDLGIKHKKIHDAMTYLANGKEEIAAYKLFIEQAVEAEFGAHFKDMTLGHLCQIIEIMDQIQRSRESTSRQRFWAEKLVEARGLFRKFDWIDQSEVDRAINRVAAIMARAKKSNSLIEAVNSVVRRYLVTYKSIPTWFCPLFTYFWNHRRNKRGKRAGLKPVEVLAGHMIDGDWVDAIIERYPFRSKRKAS